MLVAPLRATAAIARVLAMLGLASVAGCGSLPRNAVPSELVEQAVIPGMPEVRGWAGRISPYMERDIVASFGQESPEEFPRGPDGYVHYSYLSISGGGPNGAFGAGLLNGWTASGKRPVFKIVTGVSTGALIAPFAFIGPSYDGALREFYTTTTTRNIFRMQSLLPQLLGGESLADTGPLADLIGQHVDEALLAQVADAHRRGRRLYVGTMDLDAQRFVVWNMGLIATSGRPEALALFRRVMLASASIPIAFPPVFFDVEAGGARYDEMHVDGAVAFNTFLTGGVFTPSLLHTRAGRGAAREHVYVIHNGRLLPEPAQTRRSLLGIAVRVIDTSTLATMIGDLFRIYALTLEKQASFHWITIPEGVEMAGDEVFDPVVMGRLFDVGYKTARDGPVWATRPPGLPPAP